MDSEKEIVANTNFDKCAVVLVDVAGTTTSIAFVKETLLTFAQDQVQSFLKDNLEDEEVKKTLKILQDGDAEVEVDAAVETFKKLTKENSEKKELKTLQGLIYRKGYDNGTLKSHVYSDVPKAFESWSKERKVAIYSTGSIEAQKLLFTHSTEGNLSAHISNYFDQSMGLKTEAGSYTKIAEELKIKAEEILFISDSIDELKAAKEAGVLTALVKREGNEEVSEELSKDFTVISSFADLPLDNTNKRKNAEIDETEAPPTKIAKKDGSDNEVSAPSEPSTEVTSEKPKLPEVVEQKPEVDEEVPVVGEQKSEAAEQKQNSEDKQDIKEPVVEEKKQESVVEHMEVDEIEPETKIERSKIDAVVQNDTVNATPTVYAADVTESMETEQITENTVAEVKAVAPVLNKTDVENSATEVEAEALKCDKELTKLAEEKTIETETKTEELEPTKKLEVADSTENLGVKQNGVDATVAVLEVETIGKNTENVEVAMETVKNNEQNGETVHSSDVVKAEEPEKSNKETEKISLVTEKLDNGKMANENKCEASNIGAKESDGQVDALNQKVESATENQPIKESSTAESTKETPKELEESKGHTSTDEVMTEQKECNKKSSEVETCAEETKEMSSDKKKESAPSEKCPEEAKEKSATVDSCTEESATVDSCKEKSNAESKAVNAKDEDKVADKNNISETVTNELKDSKEETPKIEENSSEIGNGSCESTVSEGGTKNGEVANGQENGDDKQDETAPEKTDIKIKKLETNAGSPAVSVEV